METVFKEGDKVYCCIHGHGVVKAVFNESKYGVIVNFGYETEGYTLDGRLYTERNPTLSFTEYTFQGFSQERPIILPEVGEFCLVRDGDDNTWIAKKFLSYDSGTSFSFITDNGIGYRQMKRIKILD